MKIGEERQDGALIVSPSGRVDSVSSSELEQFSSPRLEACLRDVARASPAEIVAAVIGSVRGFVGDNPPSDDLTLLVLRYCGPAFGPPSTGRSSPEGMVGRGDETRRTAGGGS